MALTGISGAETSAYRHILAWRIVSFYCIHSAWHIAWLTAIFDSVCVVSIIRLPQVRDVSLTDPSWSDVNGVVWSVVELNIGIVSACLPTLRPIFHRRKVPKSKNTAACHDSPAIRLRGFNKSSTGEGYGELRTSADLQGLVHPDAYGKHERDWEIYSPQKAYDRSERGRASESGLNGSSKKLESTPNAIKIITEFDVRKIAGRDNI